MQWTDSAFILNGRDTANALEADASRRISVVAATTNSPLQYRCVATPTN